MSGKEKTAYWIATDSYEGAEYYRCSNCGEGWWLNESPEDSGVNYCYRCGSRMVGSGDGEPPHWRRPTRKGIIFYDDAYAECGRCGQATYRGWWMTYCPFCGSRNKGEEGSAYE